MSLSTLRFSLSRSVSPLHRLRPLAFVAPRLHSPSSQARTYAKKSKQKQDEPEAPSTSKKTKVSANDIIPGSQQAISDPTQAAEYEKCSSKMSTAVQWFRREVAQMETRASGRVTPQLLAPVRVKYGDESADGVRLEEVATVGVRDGSTLIVTVFETDTLKDVETALYDAKIPGIVPQRVDERTIRIPIPKPTVDARLALYTSASKQSEDIRQQIRAHHSASLKKAKPAKHSVAIDEFQKLEKKHLSEIDDILAQLKKVTGTSGKR